MKNPIPLLLTFSLLFLNACSNETKSKVEAKPKKEISKPKAIIEKQQVSTEKVTKETQTKDQIEIAKLVGFKAKVKEFIQWTDSLGNHVVITSETDVYETNINKEEGTFDQNAALSCYHYLQKNINEDYKIFWKIEDNSFNCEFDAFAKFQKNVLHFTDLDTDGTKEVWVMYFTTCTSDVSPSTLKLIMYEGDKKYKMTGQTKVNDGFDHYLGGQISSVGNFKEEPTFLEYAKTIWKKNSNQNFGE